jgi:hypothetical protein
MCKLRRFIRGILHTQFAEVNVGGGLSRFSRRVRAPQRPRCIDGGNPVDLFMFHLGQLFSLFLLFSPSTVADLVDHGLELFRGKAAGRTRRINGKVKHEVADQIKLGNRTLTPEMAAKEG